MDESGGSVLSKTKKDLSYVQGKSRICKIIHEKIKATREYGGGFYPPHIQVVGLCGGGGTGKTTFCQAMCDEMRAEFNGKVFHFELDGDNELRTFQTFLTMVTGTRSEDVRKLNRNECGRELGKHVSKQRIFLAIDNVTDSPQIIAQADALLSTNYYYSKGSVVLVTARSHDQIQNMKTNIRENDCFEMPELDEHEATSLLLHHAAPSNHHVVDADILKQCLQRCSFRDGEQDDCHILPLALELLGHQLGDDVDQWMDRLDTSIHPQQNHPNPIFSILRKSFDTLSNEDQILFMDVALFYPRNYSFNDSVVWNISIFDWLHMIHGGSVEDLERKLKGLKERSLLESFDESSSRRIAVHDIWREFAAMEANMAKQKWFYDNDEDDQMYQCSRLSECSNLQRAFISRRRSKDNKLDFSHCSNLTVLTLRNYVNKTLDLSPLQSLTYLELHSPLRDVRGLGLLHHLVVLRWFRMLATSPCLEEIGLLTNLHILQLQFLPYKYTDVGRLNFQQIDFSRLRLLRTFVMSATGDGSIQLYNSRDPKLLGFQVEHWVNGVQYNVNSVYTLEGFRNFQELQSLQELDISRCACIKALRGLGELVSLVDLNVSGCTSLEELPNLQKLQRLQRLDISYCFAIRAVPGLNELVTLQELDACSCCSLTELTDLQKLQKLQRLDISVCVSIQAVPGLGELEALLELKASGCTSLVALPNLRKLQKLQRLDISGCSLIKALPGLSDLIGLLELRAQNCCNLAELPEICRLTNLQVLNLKISNYYEDSPSALIKPVSGLDELVAMRKLTIDFGVLESVPHDLGKLVKLTKLSVRGWSAKVAPRVASLPNLEFLKISYAEGVDPGGISSLTSLKHLKFYRCNFRDASCLGCSPSALQHLHLKYHEVLNLKKLLVSLLELPSLGFTVDVDVGDNRDWEPIWDEFDQLNARSLIASHRIY